MKPAKSQIAELSTAVLVSMYSRHKINIVLQIYDQCGSVTKTVRVLGYPTRSALYTWIGNEGAKNPPPGVK